MEMPNYICIARHLLHSLHRDAVQLKSAPAPPTCPSHLCGEDLHAPALEHGRAGPQEHPELLGRIQPHLGGSPCEQSVQDGPRTTIPSEVQRGEDEFVQVFTLLHCTHSKQAATKDRVRTYIRTYTHKHTCAHTIHSRCSDSEWCVQYPTHSMYC